MRGIIEAAVGKIMENPPNYSSIMQVRPSASNKRVAVLLDGAGELIKIVRPVEAYVNGL